MGEGETGKEVVKSMYFDAWTQIMVLPLAGYEFGQVTQPLCSSVCSFANRRFSNPGELSRVLNFNYVKALRRFYVLRRVIAL